jgi:fructose-bisphosphate aldolase class II
MPLVNTKKTLEMAYKNGYAIGAFNANNIEITQLVIEAATPERAPLILRFPSGARKYARPDHLRHLVDAAPDHCPNIALICDQSAEVLSCGSVN